MEVKKVVISKEHLDKIRGYVAIKPEEEFFYVPKHYRGLPDEIKAKFKLRPVAGEDAARLADLMKGEIGYDGSGKTTVKTSKGEFTIAACKKGVLGWENFITGDGEVVPCPSPVTLANIPYLLLEELADVIVSRATLTDDEQLGLK